MLHNYYKTMRAHEIESRLDSKLTIMKAKKSIIEQLTASGRAATNAESIIINAQTLTSDPEVIALMLEAKANSKSRTQRKKNGEKYEPFIIDTETEEFKKLYKTIENKQQLKLPFHYDFILMDGGHCAPIQIDSDGFETNLYSIDASGVDDSVLLKKLVGNGRLHYYNQGFIQKGNGCAIFAINGLNTLSNMSNYEKNKSLINNYELSNHNTFNHISPKFLTMSQHLAHITPNQLSGNVNKPHKPFKTLEETLEEATIINHVSIQNRMFDLKYYKYLSAALDQLTEAQLCRNLDEVLARRMTFDDSLHNTYQAPTKTIDQTQVINFINESYDGFAIGAALRDIPLDDRKNYIMPTLNAVNKIMRADSKEITYIAISSIISAFNESDKMEFYDISSRIISRDLNYDAGKYRSCIALGPIFIDAGNNSVNYSFFKMLDYITNHVEDNISFLKDLLTAYPLPDNGILVNAVCSTILQNFLKSKLDFKIIDLREFFEIEHKKNIDTHITIGIVQTPIKLDNYRAISRFLQYAVPDYSPELNNQLIRIANISLNHSDIDNLPKVIQKYPFEERAIFKDKIAEWMIKDPEKYIKNIRITKTCISLLNKEEDKEYLNKITQSITPGMSLS